MVARDRLLCLPPPATLPRKGICMAGAGETARLEMFRDLLSDAHRALDLQFGFELWDGSTIPADLPSYAMRLVIKRARAATE